MEGGGGKERDDGVVIHLDVVGKGDAIEEEEEEIHQVPCCIKYNGPSPVSHYFKPKSIGIEVDGLDVKESYFRGRKLQGTTVSLHNGYSGFVIGKNTSAKRKTCDTNVWKMKAKFQSITLWNHDDLPSKEDPFLRAFHWFDVAKALHKPVTAEDIKSAFNPGATTTG